jgi:hypothetical protein
MLSLLGVACASPWRRPSTCVKTLVTTIFSRQDLAASTSYVQWHLNSSAAQCQSVKGQASEQPADATAVIATCASPTCLLLSIRATRYDEPVSIPFPFIAACIRTSQKCNTKCSRMNNRPWMIQRTHHRLLPRSIVFALRSTTWLYANMRRG